MRSNFLYYKKETKLTSYNNEYDFQGSEVGCDRGRGNVGSNATKKKYLK